ncbi:hypothetical protein KA005_70730 [bacterium]|nr:hypothetical protein [bacterium]
MKYCKKCILPESYEGIFFNNEGICNYCVDYRPSHPYLGKEKLIELINKKRGKSKYDCVVPLSGGKDSTYILYYAVTELNLNPIAVNYDSGFQVDISKENMRTACNILGVPLIIEKSPGNIRSKMLRESLLMSKKVGYLTKYCGNCEAMERTVSINTAKSYEVPFVLWGSSALETINHEFYGNYRESRRNKKFNLFSILTKTKYKFNVLLRNPQRIKKIPSKIYPYIGYHSIKYKVLCTLERLKMDFPIKYAIRPYAIPPFTENNPEFIHFFDFIHWDSIKNIKILKDVLKWRHPINKVSRFDCLIHCLHNYEYLKKHGVSHDGVNFCNFIREKRLTREEAMARERDIVNSVDRECNEILIKIGMNNYKIPKEK